MDGMSVAMVGGSRGEMEEAENNKIGNEL